VEAVCAGLRRRLATANKSRISIIRLWSNGVSIQTGSETNLGRHATKCGAEWICGADLNGDNLRINRTYLRISDYCRVTVRVRVRNRARIRIRFRVGTCEASKFDSNSNRNSRFEFDSKVTCRFENFESAAHTVCRHTTNYTLTHCSTKTSTCAPFVVEIYVHNSTLRVAVLLEHIHNSHMTISIEHVNDYPLIRFEIRFERKCPIRRSLDSG